MKALILAAGLGERMRPLTDVTPKPLLQVGGKPLICWHLENLAAAGVREVVVNTSWLAGQFPAVLGDGQHWGLRLTFIHEGPVPLETGGALLNAMPWLGAGPFIGINGDIWTDYDVRRLPAGIDDVAHLVLVDNPPQHVAGDFVLRGDRVESEGDARLTFSGIGVYRPELLDNWRSVIGTAAGAEASPPRFRLAPLLRDAMRRGAVSGEHFAGKWTDVGTPQRLAELDQALRRAHE
ncbi:MAG: mannose-phosphate guanylyltransferase [Xanthomonadaceae bacterium]|nr:mannose-phosphate guanylyltransferase [Xanthomonadaceae bacterium]